MLNKVAIQAAYPVAVNLAARGVALDVTAESPLALLVARVIENANVLTGDQTPFHEALQAAGSTAIVEGVVPHDAAMDQVRSMVSNGVKASLSLAQGTVAPLIKSCVAEIEQRMDKALTASGSPLSVTPFYYKAIWDNPALIQACERYAGRATDVALRPLGIARPTNWVAALSTGVPHIDEVIAGFVSESSEEFLGQTWDDLYGARVGQLSSTINAGGPVTSDKAIVAYLSARHLLDNIPPGMNISLEAWKGYFSELMSGAGALVMYQLRRRQQAAATGRIILDVPVGMNGSITVFGDNYNAFLRNGGSPEAVMGAHLKQEITQLRTSSEQAVIDGYAQIWRNEYSVIQQRLAYQRQDLVLRTAKAVVAKAINDQPEPRVVPAEVMHAKLNELVTTTTAIETRNLWTLVRKLVCRSMFAHTDVERILRGVDEVAAENMNVREAAFLATADYIVEWLLSQVTVSTKLG